MPQQMAMVGSQTDHGGVVVEGSPSTTVCDGTPVSRIGDAHECPVPGHGVTPIVTGDPRVKADGRLIARVGDRIQCGAVIVTGCPAVFGSDEEGEGEGE